MSETADAKGEGERFSRRFCGCSILRAMLCEVRNVITGTAGGGAGGRGVVVLFCGRGDEEAWLMTP